MKKKKKITFKKHLKKFATGTISLFLVVLLTPFMTIVSLLIEAQHYNSSIALLDEAMGVSSVSVLADYDKWLKERWGFTACNQQSDMEEDFFKYLNENVSVLGNTIDVNEDNVKVNGLYALDDTELFKNQILQYSKYNVSTKAADDILNDFFNIFGITEALKEFNSLDNIIKLITSSEKTADSMVSFHESQNDFKKSSNDLKIKLKDCQNQFDLSIGGFEGAMNKLTKELKNEKKTDSSVQSKKNDYTKARNKYIEKIDDLISTLETYKTNAKSLMNAKESLRSNMESTAKQAIDVELDAFKKQHEDAKKQVKDYNEELEKDDGTGDDKKSAAELREKYDGIAKKEAELKKNEQEKAEEYYSAKMLSNMGKAANNGLDLLGKSFNEFDNKCSEDYIDGQISYLKELVNSIPTADEIEESSVADGYKVNDIEYVTEEEIDEFIKTQEAQSKDAPGFTDFIDSIIATANSIVNYSTFYEAALCGMVYTDSVQSSPASELITNIASVFSSVSSLTTNNLSLLNYWKEVKNLFSSILKSMESINNFVNDMIVHIPENIGNVFTTDRLWYMMYSYYMTTCRTDYSKKTFKTNKPALADTIALPETDHKKNIPFGSVVSLGDMMKQLITLNETNHGVIVTDTLDTAFYGAEMEYLICGSNSEIANQAFVFMMTYILRLIIDIPAIMSNAEVQGIADLATFATAWGGGFGGPVVWILEILLEPFIDTFILVNGGSIDFYEKTIYLTPSGILDFAEKVVPALVFDDKTKNSMKEKKEALVNYGKEQNIEEPAPEPEEKEEGEEGKDKGKKKFKISMPKIDYRQQCLILMLLFSTNDQITGRLQDLVQMEGKYYYQENKKSDFSLNKCYTFVETEADVKIKQIMPSLTDSSLFEVKRKIYRGY